MIRVVHLLGKEADLQAGRGAAGVGVGSRGMDGLVRRIGLGGEYRSAVGAAAALRFGDLRAVDLVHAWDGRALAAAMAGRGPVVFSPSALTPSGLRRLALAKRLGSVELVCATEAEREAANARRVARERCHVIRPAVAMEPTTDDRRRLIRERLGIAPEDYVLLAPGESCHAAGHRLAVHVASILHVLDARYRIVLWGRGPQARGAAELGRKLKQPRVVICAEQTLGRSIEFEELTVAADVALVTARQFTPILPWAMCMAAGLPIVAADGRQAREVFGQAASIVEMPGPRTLANRVLGLSENPEQARELGRAAAVRAKELFGVDRFVSAYQALYARVCRSGPAAGRDAQRDSVLSSMTVTGPSLTR